MIHTQDNARQKKVYAAMVSGTNGELYVRVGGSDGDWQPYYSNYKDYREYAAGNGWKVWVKIPGNPEVKQAALPASLPVPTYREPQSFTVTDEMIAPR